MPLKEEQYYRFRGRRSPHARLGGHYSGSGDSGGALGCGRGATQHFQHSVQRRVLLRRNTVRALRPQGHASNGSRSTIGFDFQNAPRFGLFRRDLSSGAIAQGQRVHGSPFNAPETLVQGPQGSIWALDRLGNRVAVIGPGTAVHEYELPTPYSDPGDIIATRKFVWVVERRVAKIARFSSDGSRMEFALGVSQWYMLRAILGADERIWFTDGWNVNAIDESGKITRYGAGLGVIKDMAIGSDSRLWVIGSSSAHGKHGPFASVMLGQNLWREFLLSFAPDSIAAAKTGFWIAGTLSSLSFLSSQGLGILDAPFGAAHRPEVVRRR